MQFHEYITLRSQFANCTDQPDMRTLARHTKPAEFRQRFAELIERRGDVKTPEGFHRFEIHEKGSGHEWLPWCRAEQNWVESERPFYNFWPIAVEIANGVKLDIPFSAIKIPFEILLLRFARGHEPSAVKSVLVDWGDDGLRVYVALTGGRWAVSGVEEFAKGDLVEDWVQANAPTNGRSFWFQEVIVRVVAFIGLLSRDTDMITPVVLSKDATKHDTTTDLAVKEWIENRAARKLGRGFDVGKKLTAERETSPHWRNPHLALFWTGPGRTKPIIQMRRGAVVQSVSMADVPTGYLGLETAADDKLPSEKTPRDVSTGRRFDILKRDGYQCQLCGKTRDDGVKLHVDHKTPLAKGGSNNNDNLWTLCDECNLGKSDKEI